MPRINQDLTGQVFGRLTVKEQAPYQILPCGVKIKRWYCDCECGGTTIVSTAHLKNGHTKSCGCLRKEPSVKTHRMSKTRLYSIWNSMKTRCYNSKSHRYKDYGGRGIKICDEWRNDFNKFYTWAINNGYDEKLTIDRKDVNGDYEPSNCRWVTWLQQSRNKKTSRKYKYNGEELCLSEWAERYGIKRQLLSDRLNAGWKFEDAIGLSKEDVRDNNSQYVDFHGERIKLKDLSKIYDVPESTIRDRLNHGYKNDDLVSKIRLKPYRVKELKN